MRAVDAHAHVFIPECPTKAGARYCPNYPARLQDWMALWPAAGLSHGVLVQPSFFGCDNSYLLAQLDAAPRRLRAVVVIDPETDSAHLERWNAAGVRGMRLNLIGEKAFDAFAMPAWRRLFGMVSDLGWHIEIQCEGERIEPLLAALSGVRAPLVFDHFGLPQPEAAGHCGGVGAILQLARTRSVYVKLSAPYRLRGADARAYAARYVDALGPDQLLWGSDWPWTNHETGRDFGACRRLLDAWVPDAGARRRILWDTPAKLYGFDT